MLECLWADADGVPPLDRGLAYGDGLFETIRINGHVASLGERHLRRMQRDAARLGISVSYAELADALERAVERYAGPAPWVLKLLLTRGVGGRGYRPPEPAHPCLIISHSPMPAVPEAPVAVDIWSHPLVIDPLLAGIKHLNRLPQVMASRAMPDWAWETLMTDVDGALVEGSRTNLIALAGTVCITPPAGELAVAGVAREALLEALPDLGLSLEERAVTDADMTHPEFGGLLLTNSVVGGVAIERIGEQRLPITERLATIRSFLADAVGS
ncbi:aminotransferase class IV [Marinobacter sp. JSM 1782161]|uniref:aminotransferase class IV n=1 Tax=Marinobacter sp. JSM 1782161 TaxID=2685906 RepID=UPI0014036319|nr:aminotransferase class IV [Marinobacter sp. JSM 1782161]